MSITLFDAAAQIRAELQAIDPETGEIGEGYAESLELFQKKGAACVAYCKDEAAQIKAMQELLKEAAEKVKARANRLERFKQYMADSMKAAGVDVIDAGFLTAKLLHERDESIELDEGAEFPPELCNAPKPPEPSKTKIKAAILAGEAVAGARIVRKDRLEIK